MADVKAVKVGARVEVVGKGVIGTVAYIGATLFSSGKNSFFLWKAFFFYLQIYILTNQLEIEFVSRIISKPPSRSITHHTAEK